MTTELERRGADVAPEIHEGFIERLAQRMGVNANATAVYAPPVERDGVTVIGVAKARWGFGGGGGHSGEREAGSGGGGGMSMTPVGYIEIRDGASEFKPIRDPVRPLLAVAMIVSSSGFAAWLILRGVRALLRR